MQELVGFDHLWNLCFFTLLLKFGVILHKLQKKQQGWWYYVDKLILLYINMNETSTEEDWSCMHGDQLLLPPLGWILVVTRGGRINGVFKIINWLTVFAFGSKEYSRSNKVVVVETEWL